MILKSLKSFFKNFLAGNLSKIIIKFVNALTYKVIIMKMMNDRKMKASGKYDSPLPVGDKAHQYPKGANVSMGKYPDTPEMVAQARDGIVKDVKGAMKPGLRN